MKIIVVESSAIGRKILQKVLKERNYTAKYFSSADDALEFLQTETSPVILLTSFETDGMHGLDLVWQSRLLAGGSRALYIIAMSSSKEMSKAIEALDCGADDFIRKPTVPEELYAKIRSAQKMLSAQQELRFYATRDPLTKLYNRRCFFEEVKKLPQDGEACLLILDIDHFKSVNDTYGHQAGDMALVESAKLLLDQNVGIVSRLGGEEFAIYLHDTTESVGKRAAESFRACIEAGSLEFQGKTIRFTVSIGLAFKPSGVSFNVDELYGSADEALYEAKKSGRNRVCIGREVGTGPKKLELRSA
ncbi:response regulator [Roseibium sp. TrichSKD4]|uniref:GGDEF domain-containing response regulator n=1 Tax=Roseibium sp. TrichSKD4 TaxID=744980 RepID=UPI0001E56128|nr:diguanylate cyclase response regulator [Roseibium sp. TrichSKD4]EFO34395.1 response regulator [Roseibium sp. TrichSKD4]